MRKLFDKDNGLLWVDYFTVEEAQKDPAIVKYFKKKFLRDATPIQDGIPPAMDFLTSIDGWTAHPNAEGIKQYILTRKKDTKLGSFFFSKYFDPNREVREEHKNINFTLAGAFKANTSGEIADNEPIGLVLIGHERGSSSRVTVSYPDFVEYIITNPEIQSKGVGARMLDSICENLTFFTRDPESNNLATYVKDTNTPSLRLFKSAGFKAYKQPYIEGMTDNSYHYITLIRDNCRNLSKTNKK